jgi:CRP-like cAMP-binding protein
LVFEITNIAYVLMLVALGVRNILWLRIILVSAQITFIVYGLITPNLTILIWNCIFLAINSVQSTILILRRRPIALPTEIEDLHENKFSDMSRRDFLYFWQIGKTVDFIDQIIIHDGEHQDRLLLILKGEARVIKKGKEIALLSRGDFIAEMSFLSEKPAFADVKTDMILSCIEWEKENLSNLEKLNPALWSKLQRTLSKDLITKVKKSSLTD